MSSFKKMRDIHIKLLQLSLNKLSFPELKFWIALVIVYLPCIETFRSGFSNLKKFVILIIITGLLTP